MVREYWIRPRYHDGGTTGKHRARRGSARDQCSGAFCSGAFRRGGVKRVPSSLTTVALGRAPVPGAGMIRPRYPLAKSGSTRVTSWPDRKRQSVRWRSTLPSFALGGGSAPMQRRSSSSIDHEKPRTRISGSALRLPPPITLRLVFRFLCLPIPNHQVVTGGVNVLEELKPPFD